MRKIISCVFVTTVFAVAAVSVKAEIYSWTGAAKDDEGNPIYSWSTTGNWSPEGVPGEADDIKPPVAASGEFIVDLGGAERTVGRMDFTDVYKNFSYPKIELRNGTLILASGIYDPKGCDGSSFMDNGVMPEGRTCPFVLNNATLKVQNEFMSGCPRTKGYMFSVGDGSSFILDHVNLFDKFSWVKVLPGGAAEFTFGKTVQKAQDSTCRSTWCNEGGVFSFPAGFVINRTKTSGWSKRASFRLQQKSGVMKFGGDVSLGNASGDGGNAMGLYFQWSGGTVHAMSNVTFNVDKMYQYGSSEAQYSFIEANSDVTAAVDKDMVMDMARIEVRDGVKMTKTGKGALHLADVPYSLDIQNGTVTFAANTRTEMGSIRVCEGASFTIVNENTRIDVLEDNAGTIIITKPGLFIEALGEGANLAGDFRFEVSSFVAGDTLVETSDAALREKIFECASADFAKAGVKVLSDGDKLIAGASTFVFDSATLTDIFNPEGWQSNSLPGEGSDVFVSGEGVNAMASSDALSRWGSITVRNGATFSVSVDGKIEMPLTVLRGAVTLNINSNASFSSLSAVVDGEKYPTLTVGPGATLTVPAGFKFSNMHLVLCDGATLTESGDGPFVFGYAEAGERAYFSMHATNATITALNADQSENASRIDFASPASGGTVVVDGDIVLKNCIFTYNSRDGFAFGRNNPMAEKFKIIADNTALNFGADTYIAGGANLVMTNGSVLCRQRHKEGDEAESWYNLRIVDAGLLTLVDRGELRTGVTRVNGDVENGAVYVTPEEAGRVGIEVLEGGIGCWYKGHGKSKGVIRFADGVMECFKGYWHGWGNRAHIFNFMAGIDVPEGKTMTLCGVSDKLYTNDTRERLTIMLESPITGGGDVIVTNTWSGKTMMPVVMSSANTCTGRIEAFECVNDETKAMVYFEDGANWAGTVVANGRMGIAEKFTDSSNYKLHGPEARHNNPVTVTFAALDLQADFPIKVWKNEGEAITNDTLNVDRYVNSGGKLVPEMATDGAEFVMGDKIRLGKIKRGAELPSFARGWILSIAPIDGDEEFDILSASFGRGFMVIVR